jgi:hypothetical protein
MEICNSNIQFAKCHSIAKCAALCCRVHKPRTKSMSTTCLYVLCYFLWPLWIWYVTFASFLKDSMCVWDSTKCHQTISGKHKIIYDILYRYANVMTSVDISFTYNINDEEVVLNKSWRATEYNDITLYNWIGFDSRLFRKWCNILFFVTNL